ncbi:MAG: transposase [Eubacteriaceae bacterium]|nr:transposase [Eubacteriaceae bacterium]
MARSPREQSKSNFYHVMIRGNARRNIFNDDEDKQKILVTVKKILDENVISLYAYCVLDDHAHFIVEDTTEDISNVMKRINISYAAYFNRKYHSAGQVFYDRFKSECIENEKYLLEAIRFIHNNPVRDGYAKGRCQYKWSSYCEYVQSMQDRMIRADRILQLFSGQLEEALRKFMEYSSKENNDAFMDHEDNLEIRVIRMINEYLIKNNIRLNELGYKENIGHRDKLILALNDMSVFSIRKIAALLELNRGVVYKTILSFRDEK